MLHKQVGIKKQLFGTTRKRFYVNSQRNYMQNHTPIIQIQNLVKSFKGSDTPVVKGVSFTVNTNEVFGLLGPNGAGKTTIISMLCQLFAPTSGEIIVDGKLVGKGNTIVKEMMGVVPQDIALYPTLTARENLHFYGAMYH